MGGVMPNGMILLVKLDLPTLSLSLQSTCESTMKKAMNHGTNLQFLHGTAFFMISHMRITWFTIYKQTYTRTPL